MSENFCLNEHALPRASIFIYALTRADSFSCVDTHHDVMGDITTHYGLIRLPRPTMFDLFILTRSKPPKKKKKKERKGFDQTLNLDQKSKFSKRTCPTQFFEYISTLGSVSSFKTRKLCKLSNFQKVDFCTNLDQKSKFSRRTCPAQFFT